MILYIECMLSNEIQNYGGQRKSICSLGSRISNLSASFIFFHLNTAVFVVFMIILLGGESTECKFDRQQQFMKTIFFGLQSDHLNPLISGFSFSVYTLENGPRRNRSVSIAVMAPSTNDILLHAIA